MADPDYSIPNDDEVSPDDIHPDADLQYADLQGATLTDADLRDATLRGADLRGADLRDAYLTGADLSDATLTDAELSNKDLSGVNLSRADLRGVTLSDITADQTTTVGKICPRPSTPDQYDTLAQAYHDLKNALSAEGLSQRARRARILERQARTAEARARAFSRPFVIQKTRSQFLTWFGGVLSRYLTGYGTRPAYVLGWTALILLVTTLWFTFGPSPSEGWRGGPLYYSVVTFVTAPPHPPTEVGPITRAIVLGETYVGTALIVLLGYVLGTRDRI